MVYYFPRHLNEGASYRAASWEWSSEDAFYHAPRGIVTQHDGMESHRWNPGAVDAAIALRVHIPSLDDTPSTLPLCATSPRRRTRRTLSSRSYWCFRQRAPLPADSACLLQARATRLRVLRLPEHRYEECLLVIYGLDHGRNLNHASGE